MSTTDYEIFELGDVVLGSGATLRGARLAYKTYGKLNGAKSNAVVYPTRFGGRHPDNEWLMGDGMALDPKEYFVVVPNMLGNGLSSSPSNTPPPYDRARFPQVTVYDNVAAQHRLVTERFGIERLALVVGYSMGAHAALRVEEEARVGISRSSGMSSPSTRRAGCPLRSSRFLR